MKKLAWRPLAFAATLAALPLSSAVAVEKAPEPMSADVVAAMTPEEQGRVLEPLRVVADAASRAGRGTQADVYTQVEMAPDYRSVNVYLTDPDRAPAFLDAVRKANPQARTELLTVRRSAKSRQVLRKEITALMARKDLPFAINKASSTVDGSAIDLGVDDPTVAQGYFARPEVSQAQLAAGATPVRVRQSPAATPLSRWNDTPPFYAAAALGPIDGSRAHCTSGIPGISTADGRQWLVTAGHCYNLGDTVWAAGGNRIGVVQAKIADLDAGFIETPTAPFTWDGLDQQGYVRRLNGVRDVAVGDFVCQLGYSSKVVCNIRTTNAGDASWPTAGVTVFGSEGVPQNGGVVARGGDSGGPVITINDPDSRQLNGMVVDGFDCTFTTGEAVCTRAVAWVDVLTVFDRFALRLAD
ncbi:hypothetical protein ACFVUN_31960 [Kitasatospora griseola]|uniref:hypothetical protein n=1 Tax=Kitasatospora griseola TaxID=2064 RepID=UPI0036DB9021